MNHQYNNEMTQLPYQLWKERGIKIVCAKSNPRNKNADTRKHFHVRDLPYNKLAEHIKEAKAQTMGLILMIGSQRVGDLAIPFCGIKIVQVMFAILVQLLN